MTYTLFLLLVIGAIISQTIHTWFVFQSFSRLQGGLKTFQSVIFCSIISVAIFAFVIVGKPWLALLGAFIEVIINMYYYAMDFFENGIRKGSNTEDKKKAKEIRKIAIITFWRRNWVAIFFGLLIPMLIYVFSLEMMELK
jgi:hypothetical protein